MFKHAIGVFLLFFLNFIASQEYDLPENISENFVFFKDKDSKIHLLKNNIDYVENKCTKMEYQNFFLKKRQAFPALSN